MRIARLRHRMLFALGIPACSSAVTPNRPPPPPPPPPPPIEDNAVPDVAGNGSSTPVTTPDPPAVTPTRRPVVIASPAFDAACRVDTLPERVCGLSDTRHQGSTCGPSGDHIENYGPSATYVTPHRGKPGSALLREFVLDPDATAAYQKIVTPAPDMVPRYCCWARCTPLEPVANPTRVANGDPFQRCIPAPPAGTSVPHASNKACPASIKVGGAHESFMHGSDGLCCYQAYYRESDEEINERLNQRSRVKGRAARVAGVPIVAPTAPTDAWRTDAGPPEVTTLDPDVAAKLAAGWLTAAQMEHASVASFMALGLQLLALGAPPELVAACNRAALDEIEHARVAFELASAYAQRPVGPAPFPSASRLSTEGDLSAVALHTFVDGCIAETTAALEASRAADGADDPVVASVLRQIAEDEARHAELAWSIVGWCVRASGPTLLDAFHDIVAAELTRSDVPDTARRDDLARHGLLSDATVASLRAEIVREVVVPCLAALAA